MNRLERVLGYLRELNFKPDLNKFVDKLIIQKVVCLLELMGSNIGYKNTFSLYVRGPYSPTLTKELYANKNLIKKFVLKLKLSKKEKTQISKLYELSDHLNPDILEIMSTYAYLIKQGENEKDAIRDLKRLKSFYSESKLMIGVSKTKELFLESNSDEIENMISEFKQWENASIDKRE